MSKELTKANINLFAILRNLEDLCELDSEMKALIKNKNISIQFSVKNGPDGFLTFKNGKCSFKRGKEKCNIKLYFKSPKHFNDMFEGKANPIPLKGFTKLNFLKNEFAKLTEKLTYYLTPTDSLLNDPPYLKINTILTAYTAFFALAQIGNTDTIGKMNASRIPDGTISVSVQNGGPAVHLTVKNGHLETEKGIGEFSRASMTFSSIKIANSILNGKIDSYTCIGSGDFQIKGYIPMIDNMNKLLAQVPSYLS
ncbi:putative sterol carrier protein [Brassicibacter mesophilus]